MSDVEPHHGPKVGQGTSPAEKHMPSGEGGGVVEMASWDVIISFHFAAISREIVGASGRPENEWTLIRP